MISLVVNSRHGNLYQSLFRNTKWKRTIKENSNTLIIIYYLDSKCKSKLNTINKSRRVDVVLRPKLASLASLANLEIATKIWLQSSGCLAKFIKPIR